MMRKMFNFKKWQKFNKFVKVGEKNQKKIRNQRRKYFKMKK